MFSIIEKSGIEEGSIVSFKYVNTATRKEEFMFFPLDEALKTQGKEIFQLCARQKILDLEREDNDFKAI
jgi:hypothetical protein